MHSVVIDSMDWIEYSTRGRLFEKFAAVIRPATPQTHLTPSIVFYEVFKKIAREQGEKPALEVAAFIAMHTAPVEFSHELAVEAAKISSAERLPVADAITYATAKRFNAKIYSNDAHFKGKPGVEFID